MPKSARRQFLVKVSGIDGYFQTKTGGHITAEVVKVWDGGALRPDLIPGPPSSDNVVVGRPYDSVRDAPLVKLKSQVGRLITTIHVQPTDRDLVAVGDPEVYANCLLTSVRTPDPDAGSGDAAHVELEFTVSQW